MFVKMCAEITIGDSLNKIRLVNDERSEREFGYGVYCNSLSEEYRRKYYFSHSLRRVNIILPTKCSIDSLLAATEIAKASKKIVKWDIEQMKPHGLMLEVDVMTALQSGIKVTPVEWDERDNSSWFDEVRDEIWSWYEAGKPRYVKVRDQNEILRKMGYGNTYPIYLGVPDLNLRLAIA